MSLDPNFTRNKQQPKVPLGNTGGTFTPSGFVPNKTKVTLPTDQAPYRHGKSPAQVATKSLASTGEVTVVDKGPTHSDVQRGAQTMQMQRMLNARGAHLAVDGQWGSATEAAYQAYLHHTATAALAAQRVDASRMPWFNPGPTPHSVHEQVLLDQEARRRAMQAMQPHLAPAQTHFSTKQRFAPHFKGEPIAGYLGALRGPDGRVYMPGERAPVGSHPTNVPYYTDANTHASTRAEVAATNQQTQFEAMFPGQEQMLQQANKVASPAAQAVIESVAGAIPGVATAKRLSAGQAPSVGSITSDVANAVLLVPPAKIAQAARAVLGARGVQVSEEEARAAVHAADAIQSASRDQVIAAIQAAPRITATQQSNLVHIMDTVATVQARRTGMTPGQAWDSLFAGAQYEGRSPTADELLSNAYAQLGEGATPPWHEIPAKTTFQDAITAAPNSDMLKNAIEHVNGVVGKIGDRVPAQPVLEAQKTYDDMLRGILERRGLKEDTPYLTKADRSAAEEILHTWANDNPSNPLAQQLQTLSEAAQSASNALDPEHYFSEGNTFFGSMKRAQRITQMLRQDEATGRVVKGMVVRAEDMQHFLTLFKGADTSTVLHELAHAVEKYLPDMGLSPEELARSVEQYFRLGVAPTKALEGPMRAIAENLSEIYHAQNVPGHAFNPEVGAALDKLLGHEAVDPTLEAAAMQVTHGNMSVEASASMFGLQARDLRSFIDSGGAKASSDRVFGNLHGNVQGRNVLPAATAEDAKTILDRAQKNLFQEGGFGPGDIQGGSSYSLPKIVMNDARAWLADTMSGSSYEDTLNALHEMSDSGVRKLVEKRYDGGWEQFLRDGQYSEGIPTTEPVRDLTQVSRKDRVLLDDIRNAKPEDFFFQEGDSNLPPEDLAKIDPENLGRTYQPVSDLTPEQQLRQGLKGAASQYGKERSARGEELRARLEKANEAMRANADNPDEAIRAFKQEMRGPYMQIDFHGLKTLDAAALRYLKQYALDHPGLKPFQKVRVAEALDRAVLDGKVPRPAELREIERVFGPVTARGVFRVAEQGGWDKFFNLLNVPRSLQATADASAGLRQALVAGASHPIIWGRSWPAYIKSIKSGANYETIMQSIKDDPWYTHALAGGVSFTDLGEGAALSAHEEAFASDYAARIPGVGHVVKGSARGYTAFLNKIRMDAFAHQMRIAAAAGRNLDNETFLTKIADVVNASTGRGTIHGRLEHILPALNTMLFSPRLMLSRINYLDPTWYYRLGRGLPAAEARQVRIEALRGLFATAGVVTSTLALVSQIPGVTVELDPTSSDFGKAKFGNTRVDIAGGFQQYVHLAAMLIENAKKSSMTGVKKKFDGSFGSSSRWDEMQNFVYNKFAPVPSAIRDVAKGHDLVGNSLGAYDWKVAATRLAPLVVQDSLDLFNDRKRGLNGIAWALGGYGLGAVGVGMQTYAPKNPADKSLKRWQKEAKAAGVTLDAKTKTAIDHNAHLDSITQTYKGDPQKALFETIKYYASVTGDHQWDRLIGLNGITDAQARQGLKNFRNALVGQGLSAYEKRLKAAGGK